MPTLFKKESTTTAAAGSFRMSLRLRKAAPARLEVQSSGSSQRSPSPPPKKRRRAGARTTQASSRTSTRRRCDQLAGFIDLPYDVLLEVFHRLNPMDILNLARTNKSLRGFLMQKSSAFVWKRARENVKDMPECPSDMSEPQYANLAFHPYCHFCVTAYAPTVHWVARLRCCKHCLPKNCLHYAEVFSCRIPADIIPSVEMNRSQMRRYDVNGKAWFPARTVKLLGDEMSKIQSDQRDDWVKRKREERRQRQKDANNYAYWYDHWCHGRSEEKTSVRAERVKAILQKLAEMGWEDEIGKMENREDLTCHKLVSQPKKLTERSWGAIMPTLISFLTEHKKERIWKENSPTYLERFDMLSKILKNYASSQPVHTILPKAVDLLLVAPIRHVIQNLPVTVEVTLAHFREAIGDLDTMAEKWRQSKKKELIALMQESLSSPPLSSASGETAAGLESVSVDALEESVLELATTFFKFKAPWAAWDVLRWHFVLVSSQARVDSDPVFQYQDRYGSYANAYPLDIGSSTVFHREAFDVARRLLADCGRDPDTATMQSVMDLEFECCACSNERRGKFVMKWPILVQHVLKECKSRKTLKTAAIVEFDSNTTSTLEICRAIGYWAKELCRLEHGSSVCIHCKDDVAILDYRQHLLNEHPNINDSIDVSLAACDAIPSGSQYTFLRSHNDYNFYHSVMRQYTFSSDTTDWSKYRSIRFNAQRLDVTYVDALHLVGSFLSGFTFSGNLLMDLADLADYASSSSDRSSAIWCGVFMLLDKTRGSKLGRRWRMK